jgi:hypothetical protein
MINDIEIAMPYMRLLQIGDPVPEPVVTKREAKKRGVYKSSLVQIHEMITEGKSWDEIKHCGFFPSSTYYDLKKKYEAITGIGGNVGHTGHIKCNKNFNKIFDEITTLAFYSGIGQFYLNANGVLLQI